MHFEFFDMYSKLNLNPNTSWLSNNQVILSTLTWLLSLTLTGQKFKLVSDYHAGEQHVQISGQPRSVVILQNDQSLSLHFALHELKKGSFTFNIVMWIYNFICMDKQFFNN